MGNQGGASQGPVPLKPLTTGQEGAWGQVIGHTHPHIYPRRPHSQVIGDIDTHTNSHTYKHTHALAGSTVDMSCQGQQYFR